jgi:hypothetical protein
MGFSFTLSSAFRSHVTEYQRISIGSRRLRTTLLRESDRRQTRADGGHQELNYGLIDFLGVLPECGSQNPPVRRSTCEKKIDMRNRQDVLQ